MEASSTLRFEPNVPVDVVLKYSGGFAVTSRATGQAQMMYTLTDGRRMYLDPDVAARVDELRAKQVTICKVGKGKDAQWAVGTKDQVAEAVPAARRPAPIEFAPKPTEPADQVLSRKLTASADNSMRFYLKAAVSAAAETEKYAHSIGRELQFSSGDILTAAIFLAQMGGGR
jgi:hypothetical protein